VAPFKVRTASIPGLAKRFFDGADEGGEVGLAVEGANVEGERVGGGEEGAGVEGEGVGATLVGAGVGLVDVLV
jgi:hypothetical protein